MLLCIDTASRSASVAAAQLPDHECDFRALPSQDTAAHLAAFVKSLIDTWGQPTSYAIDLGPGSFTGLRVGLAFAKGLARAIEAPAVGLWSLDVLAEGLSLRDGEEGLTCMPASGGALFAALYQGEEDGFRRQDKLPIGLYRPEVVEAMCVDGLRAGGEGLTRLSPGWVKRLDVDEAVFAPRADMGARLALRQLKLGMKASQMGSFEPAYFQLSAAEENLRTASKQTP